MMRDDDSRLSAYIDDQLDSDQRQRLESDLVSNPRLAEELRGLTAVHDLVAGLPRDASVNVTPQVMERIRTLAARRARFWVPRRGGSRPALVAGAMFASAALVVFAVTLALSLTLTTRPLDRATGPIRARYDAGTKPIAVPAPSDIASASGTPTDLSHTVVSAADVTSRHAGARLAEQGSAVVADVARDSRDFEHVRQLLDHPGLRRLFFVRNGPGGKAEQQVARVIQRTTRYGFFKITVAQGIVIDPRHPGEAAVYAFVVTPRELNSLRDQFKSVLTDTNEEARADPGIVTQLADIRQVQSMTPSPFGNVSIPRDALAFLAPGAVSADSSELASATAGSPASAAPHVAGRAASESAAKRESAKSARTPTLDASSPKPNEELVVLVWVYMPRTG
jgi:hypothetical protein